MTDHLGKAVVSEGVDPDPVSILHISRVMIPERNPCMAPTQLWGGRGREGERERTKLC